MLRSLSLLLLAATPALAAGEKLLSVLELRNKLDGADRRAVDPAYMSDRIRAEVLDLKLGLQVMTRENMLVLLQAQGKLLADCEGECEVDTGRRLGADYVVSGEVLRVGAQLKASLKLHDTHSGTLVGAVSASGVDVEALDQSLPVAVKRLTAALRQDAAQAPVPVPVPAPVAAPPAARPVSQGTVTLRIPAPGSGTWLLVSDDGSVLCQLPCERRLERSSSYYAERDADRVSDRTRIPIPSPSNFAPGRSANATFYPGRPGNAGGLALIVLGLSAGAVGVGMIAAAHDTYCYPTAGCLDARDDSKGTPTIQTSPSPSLSTGVVVGGAAAAAVGLVLLLISRDEHYEAELAGGQARVHLLPGALALAF